MVASVVVVVVVVQQPALPVVGSVAAGSWMQRRSAARRSVEELPTCYVQICMLLDTAEIQMKLYRGHKSMTMP